MEKATILKVLLQYGKLEEATLDGDEVKIVCPFHEDTHPSCGVSLKKGLFFCFACGEGGNMPKLVTQLEALAGYKVDPLQALLIAEGVRTGNVRTTNIDNNIDININVVVNHVFSSSKEKTEEEKKEDRKNAARFYRSLPSVDWYDLLETEAYSYMSDRGYTASTLNQNYVKLNKASLNPIVIPLLEDNLFRGYVSRRIDSVKERKYVNSTGLEKKNILIGPTPIPTTPLLVVEGPGDKLAGNQLGMKYVNPLLGWKISDYQVDKIGLNAEVVIWATDNDPSGEEGFMYAKSIFKVRYPRLELVRFPYPPGVKDLGELVKFPSDFQKILKLGLKQEYLDPPIVSSRV